MKIKDFFDGQKNKNRNKKPLLSEQERLFITQRLSRSGFNGFNAKVRIQYTFHRHHKIDHGNDFHFPYCDACVKCAILKNDIERYVKIAPVKTVYVGSVEEEKVIIEIEEIT